jgi:hypothetical protein
MCSFNPSNFFIKKYCKIFTNFHLLILVIFKFVETRYSSLMKKDVGIKKGPADNGDSGTETKKIIGNCTTNSSIPAVTEVYEAADARTNGHDTIDLSLRLPAG